MKYPLEIVQTMLQEDAFSNWLGIQVEQIDQGSCTLSMEAHSEMVNGFSILHGGISYALADSALAFASNAYGYQCVSIETSISHIRPAKAGEKLIATATEIHRGKTVGRYEVIVADQHHKTIAHFKGTVHISEKVW